ncbi:hypothetical protein [Amycolatopsis sp. NPDC051372]|uniref:hypothetical protein n=1 Tax=Amycolatopsis sp. NPDC051372 TaxID=3155669 RepID=UPI0034160CA7
MTATAPAPPPVAIEAAAPTTSTTRPSGPQTEFGNGTCKVGEDIVAGTYKTAGPRDRLIREQLLLGA